MISLENLLLCFLTGKKLGYTYYNKNFHNVSLGQGQEVIAEQALELAAKNGHWVILQVQYKHTRTVQEHSSSHRPKLCGKPHPFHLKSCEFIKNVLLNECRFYFVWRMFLFRSGFRWHFLYPCMLWMRCFITLFCTAHPNRMFAFLPGLSARKSEFNFLWKFPNWKALPHYTVQYLQLRFLFHSYLEGKAGVCILSGNLGGILMGSIDRYEPQTGHCGTPFSFNSHRW